VPYVTASNGSHLNATYSVAEFQSIPGLILESWGPSSRNADYNKALDLMLQRLQAAGFPAVSVNVISRDLVAALPNFSERAIKIDGKEILSLTGVQAQELRTAIGAHQARLKVNPDSKGGNRTKRILLHSPFIAPEDWNQIAAGKFESTQLLQRLGEPTTDIIELEMRASALMGSFLEEPIGRANPAITTTISAAFARDPSVRAWVLQHADGICEFCRCPAPFMRADGLPYLEVHHVTPLAEGGSDKISNAVALCPNCHRRMHHGQNKLILRDEALRRISRLIQEFGSQYISTCAE
jgi:5-methylcytosine-specific restriction protein A